MRDSLTDSEGAEAWRAYQRGLSISMILRAMGVRQRTLKTKWRQMGYPVGETHLNLRQMWMNDAARLAAESSLNESEVVWAALQGRTPTELREIIRVAKAAGTITPTRIMPRRWREWSRAPYKHRMFGGPDEGPSERDS